MGKIAFVGKNKYLGLMFELIGIKYFQSVDDVPDEYFLILVEEDVFYKLNLKKYFGKKLLMPFRTTKKPLSKDLWFEELIKGEIGI